VPTAAVSRCRRARAVADSSSRSCSRAARASARELNGARCGSAEQLRGEVATLVFTPDRLAS
jgi:hypothetical protein